MLRGTGFALAVALGAVAVWLIVTSTTQKRIELGVLAGLWGLLLGTFSMFGSRRMLHPGGSDESRDSTAQRDAGAEVEMRSSSAVQRAEDVDARRAHEDRLESLLRHEIRESVGREVATLHTEVALLRSELLEKVGGQLRLERIETTRVIGSDLEALQHEVRQLKVAHDSDLSPGLTDFTHGRVDEPAAVRHVVEPARVRPVRRPTVEAESDVQPARRAAGPATVDGRPQRPPDVAAPPARASQAAVAGGPPSAPATAPSDPAARAEPAAAPAPTSAGRAAPAPSDDRDGLAALPRLTPFTDFELDPIDGSEQDPSYRGRRRPREDEEAEGARRSRHAERSASRQDRSAVEVETDGAAEDENVT